MFNHFANGNYQLGQHVIFPHGPLAFLMYPLSMKNNFVVTMILYFLFSYLLSFNVFRIYQHQQKKDLILPCLGLLFIHSLLDIQLLLIALTSTYLLLNQQSKKQTHVITASALAVLCLFIKSYGGIVCFTIIFSHIGLEFYQEKRIKRLLSNVFYYVFFVLILWLLMYQNLNGLTTFLRGQIELSSNNSEAVSYYVKHNWVLLSVFIGLIFIIPFVSKSYLSKYYFSLMLFPLFAAWKHGMARIDDIHIQSFISFLLIFSFIIVLLESERASHLFAITMISVSIFIIELKTNKTDFKLYKDIQILKFDNLYSQVMYYDSIYHYNQKLSRFYVRNLNLNDSIISLIKKETVDVYPFDYAIIGANNQLNWQPRPVIQSYAGYTNWLDQQNEQFILNGKSAQFFIWHLSEDVKNFSSIDSRYLLNDEPKTMNAFFKNYNLVYKDSSYLIYKKRKSPRKIELQLTTTTKMVKTDEWIDIPEVTENCLLRMKINFKKTWQGTLKSFLYKGEFFSVEFMNKDKSVFSHRIVPKNSEDGLWLYPMIHQPQNNFIEQKIKKIKIKPLDPQFVESFFELQFVTNCFELSAEEKSLNHCFFGKDKREVKD